MRLNQLLTLTVALVASAAHQEHASLFFRADGDASEYPTVPSYSMNLPVDHFDETNSDVFANRFFVNDTYYKKGGPVIFFEVGEVGISPMVAASLFAEHSYPSAPCRLAKALNGLIIGWEHRYYGYSRPVPLDDRSGLPAHLKDYQYLTMDQAIEDVAYFANRFNTTLLDRNIFVNSTAHLDPYNTPWINIGGSYPGAKVAWTRLKHPEVFYATWSSSAPLQVQADGSVYFNPVVRSMPHNCSRDIKAAVEFADKLMAGGNDTEVKLLQQDLSTASHGHFGSPIVSNEDDRMSVGSALNLMTTLWGTYQTLGPARTTQRMCDYVESFDAKYFLQGHSRSGSYFSRNDSIFHNPGGVHPLAEGIAAAFGKLGGTVALAAFLYGSFNAFQDLNGLPKPFDPFTDATDHHSWFWQSITEIGLHIGSSPQNTMPALSKFYNYTTDREVNEQLWFGAFRPKFPDEPNTGPLLALGGWDMEITNTMFTNGEFDNWRSISIASEESGYGAPLRNVTREIPACNALPRDNDVFGITFRGAVHVEDVLAALQGPGGSEEERTPLEQALELFLEAWRVWRPCFAKSRDDIRTGNRANRRNHMVIE